MTGIGLQKYAGKLEWPASHQNKPALPEIGVMFVHAHFPNLRDLGVMFQYL